MIGIFVSFPATTLPGTAWDCSSPTASSPTWCWAWPGAGTRPGWAAPASSAPATMSTTAPTGSPPLTSSCFVWLLDLVHCLSFKWNILTASLSHSLYDGTDEPPRASTACLFPCDPASRSASHSAWPSSTSCTRRSPHTAASSLALFSLQDKIVGWMCPCDRPQLLHAFGAQHDPEPAVRPDCSSGDAAEHGRFLMSKYSNNGRRHNHQLLSPCTRKLNWSLSFQWRRM